MARLQPQVVDAICNKLQDGDTDYDTTKTIDKSLDCTASLQRSGVQIIFLKFQINSIQLFLITLGGEVGEGMHAILGLFYLLVW